MKNLYKYFFIGILALTLGSCDDDEENITVVVQDTVETGAVLRTIAITSNEFPLEVPSNFIIEIEEQDEFEGDLLQSVDIFATFSDNSEGDGDTTGANFNEFSLGTIDASEFTDGPFGLPRNIIDIPDTAFFAGANIGPLDVFWG